MLRKPELLLRHLRVVHEHMRDAVVEQCERQTSGERSRVDGLEGGDVVYAIDRVSEHALLQHFDSLAQEWPCVLVAEGLGHSGSTVLPAGTDERDAEIRVLVDPIDGTRGLMYDKRSAWILTGVAPNRGSDTRLSDIALAVQTEIPVTKQHLSDALWAIQGHGASAERYNRLTGERSRLVVEPSTASSIAHGFGVVSRFFPGGRAQLAEIDDELVERLLGEPHSGAPLAFEDQYISSAGQLYELVMGHDRWIADLRPLLLAAGVGVSCAHPYDLSTELIAREAGVVVTNLRGGPLDALLDVQSNVAWLGFANEVLAQQVGPILRDILAEKGLTA